MKLLKKGLAFLMPIALTVSMLSAVDAQAAKKPKLNKTKLSVSVGKKRSEEHTSELQSQR